MAISSYGAATDSPGVVRILKDLDTNIAGRDVLVVEDIIDSGLTLYLMRSLKARVRLALRDLRLLTKPERREIEVPVKFVGFEIPNKFVIGWWPRLRRALPESALRRGAPSGSDSAALTGDYGSVAT